MKEANFSKWLLTVALLFLAGALVMHSQSGNRLADGEKDVFRQIEFARVAYEAIAKEIGTLAGKTATPQSEENLAQAKAEFEQNLTDIVDGLRLQAQLAGVGQNANEVRAATGVNAKSTVERAEDLAIQLIAQSGMLLRPGEASGNPQRTASVTNAMQKAFDDSKQRQATALAGMIKENAASPKAAKQIADELPATWKKEVGKAVELDDDAAKKALKKAEKEEKKVAAETRKEAGLSAPGNTIKIPAGAGSKGQAGQAQGATAQAAQAQGGMAAQAGQAQGGMAAQAAQAQGGAGISAAKKAGKAKPSPTQIPASLHSQLQQSRQAAPDDASAASLKLDAVDEVLMAYRDKHMPSEEDTPAEIWGKMRWMLKMGFDGRALDCLEGYRSACLEESGEEELDDFTKMMVDSAEKFIKDMRELDVTGGVMVSSIIKQDIADADEASGRESYHVGDIITSIGTNACCTVDDLMTHYAEGQPIQLYYLQETGALTNMTQAASGQDLEKTYKFREISK